MKKFFVIFLTLTIILGLCACGGSAAPKQEAYTGFQVGYAREDIMPDGDIGMSGYGNPEVRRSTGYKDILYATCLAFSEGGQTILHFSADVISFPVTAPIREAIFEKTGVPAGNIMISGTHTHSGPEYTEEPYFSKIFIPACVTAAEKAIADLAPATMYGTKALTEGMTFVRHYITIDGTYVDNATAASNPAMMAKHARETDPEMIVVKFDREEGKKDITLINWQCHPAFGLEKDTYLSADFVASLRATVEQQTGTNVIYFTGGAGDVAASSNLLGEPKRTDPFAFGEDLADYALAALEGPMTKIEGSGLKINHNRFEYPNNRYGIEKLEDAKKVKAFAEQKGSMEDAEAMKYAKELGFASPREASTIIVNAAKPEMGTMEINALYISGLAFVTAPYEMCAHDGVVIKEGSPFDFTIVCSCSNEHYSYFARKEAFESPKDIYEVTTAKFAKGAAEATAAELVSMLNALQ